MIQRGNDRGAVFFAQDDCPGYRDWLAVAAEENGCRGPRLRRDDETPRDARRLLLVTPQATDDVPRAMRSLGRREVRYVNATWRRTGAP